MVFVFQVNFDQEPRVKFLQLLGYDQNDLAKKVFLKFTQLRLIKSVPFKGLDILLY